MKTKVLPAVGSTPKFGSSLDDSSSVTDPSAGCSTVFLPFLQPVGIFIVRCLTSLQTEGLADTWPLLMLHGETEMTYLFVKSLLNVEAVNRTALVSLNGVDDHKRPSKLILYLGPR